MEKRTLNKSKCCKCFREISEYFFELNCKHKLCTRCTTQLRSGNRIVCPTGICVQVTQNVPKKQRIKSEQSSRPLTAAFTSIISQYEKEMKNKEKACFREISHLEKAVTNLKKEEKKQMEDINCVFNKRVKQLENHYGGLKSQARNFFETRERQLEQILTALKSIMEQISEEIRDLHETLRGDRNHDQIEDIRKKTSECAYPTVEVDMPVFHMKIKASEGLDLCDSIEVEAPPPTFRAFNIDAPPPVLEDANSKECDLECVSSAQWVRQEHSVKLPSNPTGLRLLNNNELWQCHNSGITVLDPELRTVREIKSESDSGDMGNVWNVTALPDGDVAVAGSYGLFLIDHKVTGTKRCCIDEGYFTGVAEHDGALYAAECKGIIRVYKQTGGWKKCRRINLGCRSQIITLFIHDNMIYTCLFDDAKLMAFRLSGEQMGSWGSMGGEEVGEFEKPYLCITGDSVLIADSDNNRLQVLSDDRKWSMVTLQPTVEAPSSALLHSGKLFVTSFQDDMIYVYDQK